MYCFVCLFFSFLLDYRYILISNQAETRLHSLERAAVSVGLHVMAHKTEYMCFNQVGHISTQDGTSLKLVDKFNYLGSSVLSTEKDIDTRLTKTWTAIDKLSVIWKSDLTDKMKCSFFQAEVESYQIIKQWYLMSPYLTLHIIRYRSRVK